MTPKQHIVKLTIDGKEVGDWVKNGNTLSRPYTPGEKLPTAGSVAMFAQDSYEVVTIPNVELFAVGTWDASTGTTTITAEDLRSAIAAQDDPAVPTPRLKIGHEENLFNEQPCFGKVINLRLSDDGMTLIGDFAGVPRWLADIMAVAFPGRSIEGFFGMETATDRTHSFVMTACALLGTSLPAVETLEDLQSLFFSDADSYITDEFIAAAGNAKQIVFNSYEEGTHVPRRQIKVAAATSVEDIRREYYDQLSMDQGWWWIRELHYDPPQLIVDMDGEGLVRVPFSADDSGNIEFGEPTEVRIEYVDVDATAKEGKVAASKRVMFSSREESRPTNDNKEDTMDPKAIREALGLAEDATDEQVLEAAAAARGTGEPEATEDPAPTEDTPAPTASGDIPDGTELVDSEQLAELRRKASLGEQAFQRQQTEDRDTYLDGKMRQGYFGRSRMAHYAAMYDADPEGTRDLLDNKLKPGLVPVEEAGGAPDSSGAAATTEYSMAGLTQAERERVQRARAAANGGSN